MFNESISIVMLSIGKEVVVVYGFVTLEIRIYVTLLCLTMT